MNTGSITADTDTCPFFHSIASLPSVHQTDNMSEKKKRINLTTAEKIDILDQIKTGETRQALCNETGVGLRTIERWIHNEKGLREEALTATDPSQKRKREGKFNEVNQALGK